MVGKASVSRLIFWISFGEATGSRHGFREGRDVEKVRVFVLWEVSVYCKVVSGKRGWLTVCN